MSRGNSREHHWWPVGLQTYWTDRNGDVSWIDPEGRIEKKKAKNRKIARKSHGHTIFRGNVWEMNFEHEFSSADDRVHDTIEAIAKLRPPGIFDLFRMIKMARKRGRHLLNVCKFYRMDESMHRSLLLILYSLVIRSPGNRFRYESYSRFMNRPPEEEVGKANMRQNYLAAKKLCETGRLSNQFFVIIHSRFKKFVFGDGSLDWLTGSLMMERVDGRALIPLTPNICVYFCTPRSMRPTVNCASFRAAPWMVDRINDIVQIYAGERIFFLGEPPEIKDSFRQRQFLEHKERTDYLIELLDEVAGIPKRGSIIAFTASV